MMSKDSKSSSFSECLVLGESEKGVVITGITDDALAAKSGLKTGAKIVAATIHLDHLTKDEVQNILKVLEPYDNNMKVLTEKELGASADLGLEGLRDSAELPFSKKNLALDTSAVPPVLSHDGLNGKLHSAQGLGGETSSPTLNGELPGLGLNKPVLADVDTKLTPFVRLTGPNKRRDLDAALKTPDASVPTPQLNTPSALLDIKKTEGKTDGLKYRPPKFAMPQFNLPHLQTPGTEMNVGDVELPSVNGSLETPDLSLPTSNLELKTPDSELNGPQLDLRCPGVNLDTPNADIEAPSGKIKWPHQKWKGLKIKGPDTDLSVDSCASDVTLCKPRMDGDLCAPDVDIDLPKADLKGPHIDVKSPNMNVDVPTPDVDIDAPSGKINWPHLKLKKPKAGLNVDADLETPDVDLSAPKVEGGINAPDVDIDLPKVDLKGPHMDVKTPNMNVSTPDVDIDAPSGKINWPHLKWKKPKAGLNMDAGLETPAVDLSAPKVEGGINAPNVDIDLPKADLKGPHMDVKSPNMNVDVPTPDVDIDSPSGKINWPHLKWKKPKAGLNMDAGLETPDVDLSAPKVEGGINAPDVDINLPKADLQGPHMDVKTPNMNVDVPTPDVDIDSPSGKINWPHLKWKKPKAGLNVDAGLETPDVDLSAPKVEGGINTEDIQVNLPDVSTDIKVPNANTEAPSGKFKFLTLKKQKVSGPKVKAPNADVDADVSAPDLKLSTPKFEGEIDAPDAQVHIPNVNADVKAPVANIETPSGKFRFPTLKKQKVSGPKVKAPNVDVDADVSAPDLKLSTPKVEGEINAPDVKSPSGKLTLKKPKFGTLKGHKADISADVPDVNLSTPRIADGNVASDFSISKPNADVKGPDLNLNPPDGKVKFPKLKIPKFKGSKVKGPELDADLKVPDIDENLDSPKINVGQIKTPDLSLSAPKIEGGLDEPDLNINLPKADLKGPNLNLQASEIDASTGKAKLPKINVPKFDLSGPSVQRPDLHAHADLKGSGTDLPLPDVDGKLTAPNINLKTKGGINAPDLNLDLPKSHLRGIDANVKIPSAHGDELPAAVVKAPNLSLPAPTIKGDLRTPHLDADVKTDIDLSAPRSDVSLPNISLSTPKMKGPDVDLHFPKASVKEQSVTLPHTDHQVPELSLKAPDLSLSSSKTAGNLSAPVTVATNPKAQLEAPHATLTAPDVDMNLPKLDLKAPESQIKTPDLGFDSHLGDFKLPHCKFPNLGLVSSDVEVPTVHSSLKAETEAPRVSGSPPTADAKISAPAVDVTALKLEGDVQGAKLDVKAPNVDANLEKSKVPHFKFPKFSFPGSKKKSAEVNASANLDVSSDEMVKAPSVEAGVSSTDGSISASELKTSLNRPEMDVAAEADAEVKGSPRHKLSWPFKSKGTKSAPDTDEDGSDVNTEPSVSHEVDVPVFKFHRLPRNSVDGIGGVGEALGSLKPDPEAKDYMVSKGIRLPILNKSLKAGEKIDIMERLKLAKEKVQSLDVSVPLEPGSSSSMKDGTFKVEKPSPENDQVSLSLSNMLVLNTHSSDTD